MRGLLTALQTAVAKLLFRGKAPITRAKDLQDTLKIRGPLAWQVFRWAVAENPFATVMFIPKPESMAKVLAAVSSSGYRTAIVRDLERAYADFSAFVDSHADDRATFDAMIAALGHAHPPALSATQRRDAYRANTQIWGVAARSSYVACIYHARGGPDAGYDSIVIKGFIGLRALRQLDSIAIARRCMLVEHAGVVTPAINEFMVFEDFCSDLGKGIRTVHEDGEVYDTLQIRGVGTGSATNVFVGVRVANLPMSDPTDSAVAVGNTLTVPSEELVLDLLVPEDRSARTTPNVFAVGVINDPLTAARRRDNTDHRLPGEFQGEYLGTSIETLRSSTFPSCPELIRAAIRRTGWSDPGFNIYRAVIPYPVLHTHVTLESILA